MNDLEKWTKVDIMKILVSFLPDKEEKIKNATQKDIDKFLR